MSACAELVVQVISKQMEYSKFSLGYRPKVSVKFVVSYVMNTETISISLGNPNTRRRGFAGDPSRLKLNEQVIIY